MTDRTLIIESAARLRSEKGQLVILSPDGREDTVPAENISIVLLDNVETTISTPTLELLSDNGAVLVACGRNHMPKFMGGALETNSLQGERLAGQLSLPENKKARLWRTIVKSKMENQAELLDTLSHDGGDTIREMCRKVELGDETNMEGCAAAIYWRSLFGKDFRRERFGKNPNPMLNYGYTILRAATVRAILCAGLLPQLGLFHHERGDAFPLADDLMEPYRPFVDRAVYELYVSGLTDTGKEVRNKLVAVLTDEVTIQGCTRQLCKALHDTIASYRLSLGEDVEQLFLPTVW